MFDLTGKVALVTGASRGIGQAAALKLAALGAVVIGTATTEAGAEKITNYLKEKGFQGAGKCLKLESKDSSLALVSDVKADYGYPNILVNNAGITRDNLTLRMKDEEWQSVIDTNLTGTFHLTKACLKPMMRSKWGRIISLSSVVALSGNLGQANYSAAKAGLIALSKSLAIESGSRGVTVNVVAPGYVNTDMTRELPEAAREKLLGNIPLGRVAEAEEIAASVCFLASPEASYITGATLNVNGGLLMA